MGSDNRGWNIVFGKARTAGVARLLGASKGGGTSILFWALILAVIVGGTKFYGLW